MTDVVRYLTSLAQALAKMSLYTEGHPVRARAADVSFDLLRDLQREFPAPVFSFIGDDVIFGALPVRELQGWDWARKLSSVGVQRLEFSDEVDREAYRQFLGDVVRRLARGVEGAASLSTPVGGSDIIRFGSIGVLADDAARRIGSHADDTTTGADDLTEEADAVSWMHEEVAGGRALPLAEAETVVHSLGAAMHGGQRILMPLLTLKEFDQYTTTHALNVAVLSMALAEHMGLSPREVRNYGMAGLLHDLGKVNVPVEVLRKPGVLTPDELAAMRRHPTDGASIILRYDQRLDLCAAVAFEHHIMIDGGGYPQRHRRCSCHNASLLVHVCDVFDALRTNRPYRVAWEAAAIADYIGQRIGLEFDDTVARNFLGMMASFELRAARAASIDGPPEAPESGAELAGSAMN